MTSGTSGATTIVQLPLAFVRSGFINPESANLGCTNQYGRYWSRSALSSVGVYYLNFYLSNIHPSDTYYRYFGYSLRCLCLALKSRDNLRHPYLSD